MTKKDSFLDALRTALDDASLVKLSLGACRAADDTLKNIIARPVTIKGAPKISLTYRHKTRDLVKNFDAVEAFDILSRALDVDFQAASLFTSNFDLFLEQIENRKPQLTKKPPSQVEPLTASHNRDKKRLITAENNRYLQALGISDKNGKVYAAAQDKFRQINKYIEILSHLVKDLPTDKVARIADMGSGKGYLTFALYDYLTAQMNLKPQVIGVEYRQDMVALCNKIAADAGFDGLSFVQGSIADYDAAGTNILIALHACDTATDDAIYKGITAGAELIVTAPCCHKQIRREMEKNAAASPLDFLLKHGIFTERQAEMVTDGLRALILNYCGYATKVFEFISDAHTPKNVMIVATKTARRHDPALLRQIKEAKAFFGIKRHHLEDLLGLADSEKQ